MSIPTIFAEVTKRASKLECLKDPTVLELESLTASPFHIITLIIFFLAIIHTLSTYRLQQWAENKDAQFKKRPLWLHLTLFVSQIEVVFALWTIPLLIAITCFYNMTTAFQYINTRDYTEALFVVVILSLTASKPIVHIAEKAVQKCAQCLGGSFAAWWFVVLTVGPIFGSFITEAGAMALCALLLSKYFYTYSPSTKFGYATLALLFVNIAVGGTLTNFASPAVLILAHNWHWSNMDMLTFFGWKSALGILISNTLYWIYFRKELEHMGKLHTKNLSGRDTHIPHWIICIHILFIIWTVIVAHYPAVFIASFLFYLGFHQVTKDHQYPIRIRPPMFIGLFLAGLVIHGGLQGWWVADLLYGRSIFAVIGITIGLSAFNDNTAISYLASLISNWGNLFEYAIFTGIIAGGGLTVLANAPNPAGYTILKPHFKKGINPFYLFAAAFIPTFILYALFYLLGPLVWWA